MPPPLLHRLQRVLFVAARPHAKKDLEALRREAVETRDVVVMPHVMEHYDNITYQTLEACRFAAVDPAATHLLKASPLNLHQTNMFHCPHSNMGLM